MGFSGVHTAPGRLSFPFFLDPNFDSELENLVSGTTILTAQFGSLSLVLFSFVSFHLTINLTLSLHPVII